MTPLMWAVENGHAPVARLLLDAGADKEARASALVRDTHCDGTYIQSGEYVHVRYRWLCMDGRRCSAPMGRPHAHCSLGLRHSFLLPPRATQLWCSCSLTLAPTRGSSLPCVVVRQHATPADGSHARVRFCRVAPLRVVVPQARDLRPCASAPARSPARRRWILRGSTTRQTLLRC